MAFKTILQMGDIQKILEDYDIGELDFFEGIAAGSVETNYLLSADGKKYILRLYEERDIQCVHYETHLLQFLKERGFPCPAPIAMRDGRYAKLRGLKPCAIFEYMPGEHLEHPTPDAHRQLIEQTARLNTLTADYRADGEESRIHYTPEFCKSLAAKIAHKIGTENAARKLEWYLEAIKMLDLPEELPGCVCHCDFHYTNVLYENGKFSSLIDFDDANYTYSTYDLIAQVDPFTPAFQHDTWQDAPRDLSVFDFTKGAYTAQIYDEALARYRGCGLSEMEKVHVFDVYRLSVFVDCLWYFARGDVSDFYEKRKLEMLNMLGREAFTRRLFPAQE